MKLIADSGSTKTTWCLICEEKSEQSQTFYTGMGINPVRDDEACILSALKEVSDWVCGSRTSAAKTVTNADISEIYFYGAGCLPTTIPTIIRLLSGIFPNAHIEVASDLLGAARALCGRNEGIACILGTGSNSGLYDGCQIVSNVSPMGWILGDEGSGAVLGRTLVSEIYKGALRHLRDEFEQDFLPTVTDIKQPPQATVIQAVYRSKMPNRFLASLVPFLSHHRKEPSVGELLRKSFRDFFHRNVAAYARPDLSVNFVGGVAEEFQNELRAVASSEGFDFGAVMKAPINGIVRYHTHRDE
ncbi:MAG: ATPase [Bacteroidaceae bacterium]|nr:ATPase [Bacteroidaceae bacterium]